MSASLFEFWASQLEPDKERSMLDQIQRIGALPVELRVSYKSLDPPRGCFL
jgi:hypothetical protein